MERRHPACGPPGIPAGDSFEACAQGCARTADKDVGAPPALQFNDFVAPRSAETIVFAELCVFVTWREPDCS